MIFQNELKIVLIIGEIKLLVFIANFSQVNCAITHLVRHRSLGHFVQCLSIIRCQRPVAGKDIPVGFRHRLVVVSVHFTRHHQR